MYGDVTYISDTHGPLTYHYKYVEGDDGIHRWTKFYGTWFDDGIVPSIGY